MGTAYLQESTGAIAPYAGVTTAPSCRPASTVCGSGDALQSSPPSRVPVFELLPHEAALAAEAASVALITNAAARDNRWLTPGIVVTEVIALLQNGHVVSFARTWRAQEGQGPSAGGMMRAYGQPSPESTGAP
jgi:hypothetical protein